MGRVGAFFAPTMGNPGRQGGREKRAHPTKNRHLDWNHAFQNQEERIDDRLRPSYSPPSPLAGASR